MRGSAALTIGSMLRRRVAEGGRKNQHKSRELAPTRRRLTPNLTPILPALPPTRRLRARTGVRIAGPPGRAVAIVSLGIG